MPKGDPRPILVADHIPSTDGKSYRVFVDVDVDTLRRLVPLVLENRLATRTCCYAFAIRLEEQ